MLLGLAGCAQGNCPDCPAATLTANGATALHAHVGDAIVYEWTSHNADVASSTVAMQPNADHCGNVDGPWVVATLSGTSQPSPILDCQLGTTYTLAFTVEQSATGESATATTLITVE